MIRYWQCHKHLDVRKPSPCTPMWFVTHIYIYSLGLAQTRWKICYITYDGRTRVEYKEGVGVCEWLHTTKEETENITNNISLGFMFI